MAERQVVLDRAEDRQDDDQDQQVNSQDQELRAATERAQQAEAELARLKASRAEGSPKGEANQASRSASAAKGEPAAGEAHAVHNAQLRGIEALRQDSMMSHLLDSLAAGKDIGHYGRLVFAMVARHFLSEDETIAELTKDPDFSTDQAVAMVRQVTDRDYSPPRRERIMEWQQEQDFVLLPEPNNPDCGNVYRTLHFPTKTYKHIEHYQEERDQEERTQEERAEAGA